MQFHGPFFTRGGVETSVNPHVGELRSRNVLQMIRCSVVNKLKRCRHRRSNLSCLHAIARSDTCKLTVKYYPLRPSIHRSRLNLRLWEWLWTDRSKRKLDPNFDRFQIYDFSGKTCDTHKFLFFLFFDRSVQIIIWDELRGIRPLDQRKERKESYELSHVLPEKS